MHSKLDLVSDSDKIGLRVNKETALSIFEEKKSQLRFLVDEPSHPVLNIDLRVGDTIKVLEPHLYKIVKDASKIVFYGDGAHESTLDTYAINPSKMPLSDARFQLIVTDIHTQTVGEITQQESLAEGIRKVGGGRLRWENYRASSVDITALESKTALLLDIAHEMKKYPHNINMKLGDDGLPDPSTQILVVDFKLEKCAPASNADYWL